MSRQVDCYFGRVEILCNVSAGSVTGIDKMKIGMDAYPARRKCGADNTQKHYRDRVLQAKSSSENANIILQTPSKGVTSVPSASRDFSSPNRRILYSPVDEMSGSQDADGITLTDGIRKQPLSISSSQKSTASSETNQLWLKMRRRKVDLLASDDMASISEKADAILLNLPLHSSDSVSDATSAYRANLESQRSSNLKQTLNGHSVSDLGVRTDPITIGTTSVALGKEVNSPYNSDHCLSSAVIYPHDSATLQESNVVKYERNPMIYNSAAGKFRGPNSCVKKKGEISSDSLVDDINSFDYESQFPDDERDDSSKPRRSMTKEREGFGTLIESLSYKLALQIENLQASIAKKDERIEELEKAAIEQMNSEFNSKLASMRSTVQGKEKEIKDMSDRSDETDNKLGELLSIFENRESNFMTKIDCDTIIKEHSGLVAEIELLKNKLFRSENPYSLENVDQERTFFGNENSENENEVKILLDKIRSLEVTVELLEKELEEKKYYIDRDRSKNGKNNNSIDNLEKLNNDEVIHLCYSVSEIDNIINKFPIGIDSKG